MSDNKYYEKIRKYARRALNSDLKTYIRGRDLYMYGTIDMSEYVRQTIFDDTVEELEGKILDLDDKKADKSDVYTKDETDDKFLTKDDAASIYQPIGDYLTKDEAAETYQPLGDYAYKSDLNDYYTKNETDNVFLTKDDASVTYLPIGDYATITYVDNADTLLLNQINLKQDQLTAGLGILIENNVISCTIDTTLYKVVTSLPDKPDEEDENKIFLVPSELQGDLNIYIEYLYVNGAWEKIGELHTEVDLSDYYTKEEVIALLENYYTKEEVNKLIETATGGGITKIDAIGTSPLNLEADVSGTEATITGSIDIANNDALGVVSVRDENGLHVIIDENASNNGEIYLTLVSTTENGAMSSDDKAKLDTLQTYDLATEESDGLMSKEDKATIDTLNSEYRLELSRNSIVFTNSTNIVTLTLTAYKGLEKVDISTLLFVLTDSKDRHDTMTVGYNINDGVATIIVERLRSCFDADGTLGIEANISMNRQQIPIGSITVPIYSADHNNAVLQGWINPVYEEDRMRAQLWTFDGSDPSVRFVRDGAYWLNLPTEWSTLLGEFDKEKMIVHVTIGGQADGTDVFCGRFYPGEDWNGDVASTDCWAAVLMLVADKSGTTLVNNSFFVSVYYLPEVNTYYADNENEPETRMVYHDPEVTLSYDNAIHQDVSQTEITLMPNLSYFQQWEKYVGDEEVQGGVTTVGGDVGYQFIENLAPNYFNVTVDETTGKVTVTTADGIWAGRSMEMATVRASVTMNGLTGHCDTTIMYEV